MEEIKEICGSRKGDLSGECKRSTYRTGML